MKRFAIFICSLTLFAAVPAAAQAAPPSGQGKSLLMQVFMDAARVHDLLDATSTANWKMTDAERGQFQTEAKSIDDQLQTLEKWRYQFYYHPSDAEAAGKTLAGLRNLIPQVSQIDKDARQYGGSAAAPFDQALKSLSDTQDSLAAYLAAEFPGQFSPQTASAPVTASAPPSQPAAAQASGAPQAAQASQAAKATQASQPPQTVPATQSTQPGAAAAPPLKANPSAQAPGQASTTAAPTEQVPAPAAPQESQPAPPTLSSDQVKALLRGIYLTDARVNDLLGLLQPEKWKMADAERAMFNERLEAVRNQLAGVEKWRYQFLYHIDKMDLGQNTVAALGDLVPGILGVETTVAQYNGKAAGAEFSQAAAQLAASRNTLAAYVAAVEAEAQKELAAPPQGLPGGKGLQTERINVAPAAPPVSSLAVEQPPLTPGQVKSILYQVYISEFRIRDLLSQERPSEWKGASAAERTMAVQSRAALSAQLAELEKWRARFSRHPGNMYDAFETYRSVNALFHPLRVFGREVGKYENQNMADDYGRREADMEAQLNGLVPYIGYILQHQDRNLEMFQADLAGCQNQLGYAMHSMVHSSQPMKNIVPVFQGRLRSRTKPQEKDKRDERKKSEKR